MTATVTRINPDYRPARTGAPVVTHMSYDSADGWSIEITRPHQATSDGEPPVAADLPADIRSALEAWLDDDNTPPAATRPAQPARTA
ncbi:hypothetical protein [Nocardia transvalensis]|uniref:hypothetical protein n=1 Tax=Nocardia transvalensis TaxID=37333 RepID=UPI0018932C0D|nr:hypothetical protein [Nocardia transvalensis]MBF6332407.1 hypothetical protein [Nocardia transvalensis]